MEIQQVQAKIRTIRGHRVMLDFDLAALYGVETKTLKRAVKRNLSRFPDDFMIELTAEEAQNLRYQFGTSSWGGSRYLPFAFTEQGVAMLSTVLNSEQAIQANIAIMRVFVAMRQYALSFAELTEKLTKLENGLADVGEVIEWLSDQNEVRADEIANLQTEFQSRENQGQRRMIGFKNKD